METNLRPYTVFILAGTAAQAREFALIYLDVSQPWTFIEDDRHLHGLRGMHVASYGTWYMRPDRHAIVAMLRERDAVDITKEFPIYDDRENTDSA